MTAARMRRIIGLALIGFSVLTGKAMGEDGRYRALSAQETLGYVGTLQNAAEDLKTTPLGSEALDSIRDNALKQEQAGRNEWGLAIGVFGLGIASGSVLFFWPEGKKGKAERR
ncbi:hypothetical protein A3A46_01760 [Candidatus Roizmanbacteria bacterium RIFCSPLOWO2_01_FULL_37_13]|uniref:Uncharacterized protein n=1 Tax=Candidatus Roizmanbacteria bacterium RIFCSPHIGHO2_02_FULL_38_11 TaxID=1802039 RepID=A0A1F7H3D7_9BACT|nr:MAG: hypothetical protein A3C25_01420 [Candidatus Roizmanbacteria bacterium RIFCSPHIGHO2_02_FULL_38_11]OGK41984.1 MAG: hypothetical protein A3A46_01760 [Candidatus Roizmanbacteria bacterium RIFCSPLOWO2_01_FULL_37_13]